MLSQGLCHISKEAQCRIKTAGLILVSFLIFTWIGERSILNENMVTYSPSEIHAFDESLFSQDIDVSINENQISPRCASLVLMKLLMRLGLEYEEVYLVLFLLANFLAALGCVVFLSVGGIGNKLLGAICYSVVFGISRLGVFAGFSVYPISAIMIGLGSALGILATILSIYRQDGRSLNVAYCLVTLAALCHIHEGIWSFLFVSLIYLYFSHKLIPYRSWTFWISAATLLLLTIPSILTNQDALSTSEFFSIYVRERIPHHLLLSYDGWRAILPLVLTWCSLIFLSKSRMSGERGLNFYVSLIALFFITLAVWYGLTEILHIPAFVKLYVSKFVKYISVPFCLLFVSWLDDAARKKEWFMLCSVLLCLFLDRELWLYSFLSLQFVTWLPLKGWRNKIVRTVFVAICAVLLMKESDLVPLTVKLFVLLGCVIAMFRFSFLGMVTLSLLLLGGLLGHIVHRTESFSLASYIEFCLERNAGYDAYRLGKKMGVSLLQDEVFLCDAHSVESSYMQHISRRSAYVLYKTVPSSDKGIGIWKNRVDETRNFSKWAPEETATFMRTRHLRYVVVNECDTNISYSGNVLFSLVEESGNCKLYKLR